jgi:hypothetical protein
VLLVGVGPGVRVVGAVVGAGLGEVVRAGTGEVVRAGLE